MKNLLVIADDLSGAADCAIAFADAGYRTVVSLGAGQEIIPDDGIDVIAVDLDSRRQDTVAAGALNQACCNSLGHGRAIYKKIDSTLRGNWAAEVTALQPSAGMAIVAPAFPAMGRTTSDSRQYVHGVPLENTDIWKLEGLNGVADVERLLTVQGLVTAKVDLETIRAPLDELIARLQALYERGVGAAICDAQNEADLEHLARASLSLPIPFFWVGSAGLARAIAKCCEQGAFHISSVLSCDKPVLVMVGSLSSHSVRQAQYLQQHSQISELVVPPALLRTGPAVPEWGDWQQRIVGRLEQGEDILLRMGNDDAFDVTEGPGLSKMLARLVAPGFTLLGGLIATGGETARAMLNEVHLGALRLISEVEPGIPLSLAIGEYPLQVVTKAGAFGQETALYNAYQYLKRI